MTIFPATLAALGPPAARPATAAAADLIDSVLAAGVKSGYTFTYATPGTTAGGVAGITYDVNADPTTPGVTGQRHFFTNQTGVIRANTAGAATQTSTPIG